MVCLLCHDNPIVAQKLNGKASCDLDCVALESSAIDCVALALMTKHSVPGIANEWKLVAFAASGKAACLKFKSHTLQETTAGAVETASASLTHPSDSCDRLYAINACYPWINKSIDDGSLIT